MRASLISNSADAERQLDDFAPDRRRQALAWLADHQSARPPTREHGVNLHIHSFFSYNTKGYSPSHIAWACRQAELYAAGLCDFDVLDGLDEFLAAGFRLGLRAIVNLETRAYLREYAAADINSPGEPGVTYIMGAGFYRMPAPSSPQAKTLADYRANARVRNIALVQRINARLPEIAIDYEKAVVPLTPASGPTERHIVRAYRLKAEHVFGTGQPRFQFWSRVIGKPATEIEQRYADTPVIEEWIRSKLAKRGGLGYEQPTEKTFPPADAFIHWVLACDAMPMVTWLDGTSPGESNMAAMLDCLLAKGACALNIIPDRNHRIADPAQRALKLKKLAEVVQAAESRDLPVAIGTEMNKDGQPFVDDLDCPALQPYREIFMRGARILTGHTWLGRYTDFGYTGRAADTEFGTDRQRRNAFFEAVGSLTPLTPDLAQRLADMGPQAALGCFRDSAKNKTWVPN